MENLERTNDKMNSTQLRPLGKTDLRITPIGLGMMEMSGGGGLLGRVFPIIPHEEKNAIIKAALDGGINWFDTAEMYGSGVSEKSLADGLKAAGKNDQEVLITTKWRPFLRTANNIPISVEDRLRFLGGYSISNFMIHQPMSFSSPETEMNSPGKTRTAPGGQPGILQPAPPGYRKERCAGNSERAGNHHHRLYTAGTGITDRQVSQEP
jgi:diketogulonate reductase-like aldo/keto reductase